MTNTIEPDSVIGRNAVDPSGDKIGKIGQVYVDDANGQASWLTVSTGLFGTRQSFAPFNGATLSGDDVQLTVTKDQVKDAPNVEDDGHLEPDEERALYEYYGAGFDTPGLASDPAGRTRESATPGTGRNDESATSGHHDSNDDDRNPSAAADGAMTRSEEQLRVGTERVETGRARLRKYVVTENVTQTVPVSHEEVRIEREPIADADASATTDGSTISEDEQEVTLHAERPVVQKEAVPVERVRMSTDTVSGEETVEEEVRKEQIDTDVDGDRS